MRRAAVAGSALLLVTACGVPQDEQPRALDRAEAPFRVFEPDVAPSPQGDVRVELFFVRGDRLVPVVREVQQPATAERVLGNLFNGVTEDERAAGLSSAIPAAVSLEGVEVRDRIAVVTLGGLNEQAQVLAFAQIVASLDGRPEIDGVRFRAGGQDVPVPRGDTSLTDEPVNRESYTELLGPPEPPVTGPPEPVPPEPVTPAPEGASPAG